MSLYRHLPNRDAVLAAVVDRLAAEAVDDLHLGSTWPEALAAFGTNYRRMLLRHPNAVPLLATHPMDVDAGLKLVDGLLARFSDAGVPQAEWLTAVQSVIVYVLGHALAQVGSPSGVSAAPPETPEASDYYQRWFTAGLTAMVGGFADRYRR
ncbi:TetR/AcrR family transcriptional regulator C-terminal domain-containing protein [Plantactinospora sonchi]|uniref:TetR/AcrR family transcriptional regulator C-terminal domain-containing protein n=1 Tax=Plantactinospora sonchi TaxID=1544735 RepID=A0ABU7S182_9ACTN